MELRYYSMLELADVLDGLRRRLDPATFAKCLTARGAEAVECGDDWNSDGICVKFGINGNKFEGVFRRRVRDGAVDDFTESFKKFVVDNKPESVRLEEERIAAAKQKCYEVGHDICKTSSTYRRVTMYQAVRLVFDETFTCLRCGLEVKVNAADGGSRE